MTQSGAAADQPGGTLEALQTQTPYSRRLRPPDLEILTGGDSRVPLKPEKVNKRESRLGLRGLFGRSRTSKDGDIPQSPRESIKTPGLRASWADLGSWTLQPQKSEQTLPAISDSASGDTASINQARQKKFNAAAKKAASVPKEPRETIPSWEPPPLFQAYPQAIRHAHLPACTYSGDTILRMNEKKSARDNAQEGLDDGGNDKAGEKKKKKHRRNSSSPLDWTTKVFVLVTSGYLLQYTGEGTFDRLPEKVLHLGKDSAAFASDAIPGRHWVLRVATTMDSSSGTPTDSRSLFSRIPFRSAEKRHAMNFLMVFEGAEDMDGWISVLRKEIESLGGKKNLSETGKPKAETDGLKLKAQVSQRTLVVRDPDRFSRSLSPHDLKWQHRQSVLSQDSGEARSPVTVVENEAMPEPSTDDRSATNSVISHDGRQLDNLRDSTGANRLSYISSGQRTIITSAASSPACSPTRDSFTSNTDDHFLREPPPLEARPRPNAAAIADRRQSMQAINLIEPSLASSHRPHSTYAPPPMSEAMGAYGPTTPNFSVPHGVSRRYSLVHPPPPEPTAQSSWTPPLSPEQPVQSVYPPRMSSRRCPPAGLMMSRPLSVVADQPSPILEVDPPATRPATSHSKSPSSVTVSVSPPPPADMEDDLQVYPPRATVVANGDAGHAATRASDARGAALTQSLRDAAEITTEDQGGATPNHAGEARATMLTPPPLPATVRRCRSSMDHYGRSRSRSPSTQQSKRASLHSMTSTPPDKGSPRFSLPNGADMSPISPATLALLQQSRKGGSQPSATGPQKPMSGQLLAADAQSSALFNRRSMPHLAEGPPPAPPPTCALPPIPQKIRVKS